ncbi:MAG: hypothetical protein JO218_15260 [Burkholderiales bacterium]|nr:hypothetical protein [Burkholderiales bacterium]
MKLRALAAACSAAFVLIACNGDGGGSSSSSAPSTVSISGVAATGVPVVGTVVTVTDVKGNTAQSSPTDANGNFTVSVTGMTGPFVLTSAFTDGDGTQGVLSSVVDGSGSLTANLNALSSFITTNVFNANLTAAPTASQITAAGVTDAKISAATSGVLTTLAPLYAALSVPAGLNPITTPMAANPSDPIDNLLDVTHPIVHNGTVSAGGQLVYLAAPGQAVPVLNQSFSPVNLQILSAQLAAGTTTPITNVIVVVGENQTFDGLFGGFQPLKGSGQTVNNLLSEGIINADGTPGPNFKLAAQTQGNIQSSYSISPSRASSYSALPQPFLTGILEPNLSYAPNAPDPRFPSTLPNGPFQITKYVPYATATSATGDPVHRFFQMWQQTGGDNSQHDMFVWPATQVGQGGGTTGITAANPGQGGELMGFVNMQTGDAPYFNALAQQFAVSDNYHQWIMGGTGMNFFALATADLPWFNYNGQVIAPPLNQIENPNPTPGTADFFLNDGYEGGSYVNCSDPNQPGVSAILSYLQTKGVPSNCDAGKYYLVNNYSPAFDMNGVPQPIGPNNYNYPAQTVPTIGDALSAKGVSWKWYTGARNPADVVADAQQFGVPVPVAQGAQYNNLGDPLMASGKIVGKSTFLTDGSGGVVVDKYGQLRGLTDFYADVKGGTLPAVSFVVPKNLDSGHPGYSIVAKYELFLNQLISQVTANPKLWQHTAIIVTTDEGGGHFDSGYIQNVDFFGDGPRIPLLVVSPYARAGVVDHVYHDHSSVLKFIERNWRVPTLSARSRDNLPNPVATSANPYKPANTRAIGDLSTMFQF